MAWATGSNVRASCTVPSSGRAANTCDGVAAIARASTSAGFSASVRAGLSAGLGVSRSAGFSTRRSAGFSAGAGVSANAGAKRRSRLRPTGHGGQSLKTKPDLSREGVVEL